MKKRNITIDLIRGLAMLMVVLGHTMTGSAAHSENSFLYNVVWSLQMPLFMLISGYVMRYSRGAASLPRWIGSKTVAYLVPWACWTFLVRGMIFGQSNYLDVKWLIWHMDSGYWFLFSLWTITVILGAANHVARRFAKGSERVELALTTAGYLLGMAALAGTGWTAGLSFLCVKLTLYYMPFYYAGYLFGRMQGRLEQKAAYTVWKDAITAICLVIWLAVITRVNLYLIADSPMGILIRAAASLSGCVAVCGLVSAFAAEQGGKGYIVWVGQHSMEVYLLHYLLLNPVHLTERPAFNTTMGMGITAVNYVLTLVLCSLAVKLLNGNSVIRRGAFGKP